MSGSLAVQEQERADPKGSACWRQDTTPRTPGQGFPRGLCRTLYSCRMTDGPDPEDRVSVTEASRRGVARLVADAAHGTEVVVERHGAPVAAVVGYDRYTELVQLR